MNQTLKPPVIASNNLPIAMSTPNFAPLHRIALFAVAIIFLFSGLVAHAATARVAPGKKVTLSVAANGTSPFSYQWKKGGANISGATSSTYVISSVQIPDAGNYTVAVSNLAGSTTSDIGTLTVEAAAVITAQPVSLTVSIGYAVSFSASVSGAPAPTFQWQKDGVNISGATDSSYTITSTSPGDAGIYRVIATNAVGSATSSSATLTLMSLTASWGIAGTGDFNGDGEIDIVWENVANGSRGVWIMNGTVPTQWIDLPYFSLPWRMVGTGDFNGDGQIDIAWENVESGDHGVWLMNGTIPYAWVNLPHFSTPWQMVGIGDMDGDGQPDIVWENLASGDRALWIMDGRIPRLWVNLPSVPMPWHIAKIGDFDGDGQSDIIWENMGSGDRAVWIMDGIFPLFWVNL